ncbi:murein biosynthesis integral membrane protein MurJ [Catellatospora chokoriensis]|nr:murein biosynthesis integral membrane protein MurJ [Catellatospora chokoriensis]
MAVATLAARATGFLRIVVIAAALGMGTELLDNYNVANTLPNAVYELVVGGAMASVVVPLLVRASLSEPDDGVEYAQRLLTLMVYGLSLVTLVALLAAPLLIDLLAPGFTAAQRSQALVFSRFFLPQILFYGVSATAGAVLNIRGRFTAPMWAPLCNNVVLIAVGLIYLVIWPTVGTGDLTTGQTLLLALGTTAGVFAQMALVLYYLMRSGFPLRARWNPRGLAVRRIGRLGAWVLISVVAGQVLLAMATRAASLSGPGGVTAYQSAYAIFQVPFAVIAVSVMTAMLPRLSRSAAQLDHAQVVEDLSRTLRVAAVAMAPIAVAMITLGRPLAALLFEHGRSVASTVSLLGAVVTVFGFTLLPFTGYSIMVRGFYALQDTKTPALISAGVATIGVAGCAGAIWLLPRADIVLGVPAAYAIAYSAGLLVSAALLRRRLGRIDGRRLIATHLRTLGAAAISAACAILATRALTPVVGNGWTASLTVLAAAGAAGIVGYVAAGLLLRLTELRQVGNVAAAGMPRT